MQGLHIYIYTYIYIYIYTHAYVYHLCYITHRWKLVSFSAVQPSLACLATPWQLRLHAAALCAGLSRSRWAILTSACVLLRNETGTRCCTYPAVDKFQGSQTSHFPLSSTCILPCSNISCAFDFNLLLIMGRVWCVPTPTCSEHLQSVADCWLDLIVHVLHKQPLDSAPRWLQKTFDCTIHVDDNRTSIL